MISKIVLPSRIRSVHPVRPPMCRPPSHLFCKQLSNAFISSLQKVEQTLCVRSCEEFLIEFRVSSPSIRFVFVNLLFFFAFVCLVCWLVECKLICLTRLSDFSNFMCGICRNCGHSLHNEA